MWTGLVLALITAFSLFATAAANQHVGPALDQNFTAATAEVRVDGGQRIGTSTETRVDMEKLASLVAHTPVQQLVQSLARKLPETIPALTEIFAKLSTEQYQFNVPSAITATRAVSASGSQDTKYLKAASKCLQHIAPPLDGSRHKGQGGRVGILGGSVDYAGAPFYSGMSSLRTGGELVYLLTAQEATGPIKAYSPELMVSDVYNYARISSHDETAAAEEISRMVARVKSFLPKLHSLTIGPGLGRHANVLDAVAAVITAAREHGVPLVIDADGVFLVSQRPDLVSGKGGPVVLTPNVREYSLLASAVLGDESAPISQLARKMNGPIIFRKGAIDQIAGPNGQVVECAQKGAPRRPGGLGDLLAGATSTLVAWTNSLTPNATSSEIVEACCTASTLVRRSCEIAYARKHRAMMAPDVLDVLGEAFESLCPAPKL